jgi:hypothetical protein
MLAVIGPGVSNFDMVVPSIRLKKVKFLMYRVS